METNLEGILTIKDNDGSLIGVVFNDMIKRSQVFYSCKEMGVEDIKQLLEKLKLKS